MGRMARLLIVATIVLSVVSCQQIFTTSLGEFVARDSYDIPSNITEAQAIDLADQAVANRDTELAQALLPGMADLVVDNPDDGQLLVAAAQTAGLATGLSDAISDAIDLIGIDNLTGSGSSIDSGLYDDLAALFDSVTVDADALSIFTSMGSGTPADLAAAGVSAGDYVIAAMALVINQLGDSTAIQAALESNTYPDPDGAGPLTFSDYPNIVVALDLIQDADSIWPDDPIIGAMASLFSALTP